MAFFRAVPGVEASGEPDICHYGGSPLAFRGPYRDPEEAECLVLGGAAVWGRGAERPFPRFLEDTTGIRVANLGVRGGGIDTMLGDPVIAGAIARAPVVVVEAPGAQNLSNAYYSVHPRRNDRFVAPSASLRTLYPDVDFADICFNRHLVSALVECSPRRFGLVLAELRSAWLRRMRALAELAPGRVVLLWLGPPPSGDATIRRFGPEPMLVTRAMLADLAPSLRGVVEVAPPGRASTEEREVEIARTLAAALG